MAISSVADATGKVTACHDVYDSGLAVALQSASGPETRRPCYTVGHSARRWAFGGDQARYVVTAEDADSILEAAANSGVPAVVIGKTDCTGELKFGTDDSISASMLVISRIGSQITWPPLEREKR